MLFGKFIAIVAFGSVSLTGCAEPFKQGLVVDEAFSDADVGSIASAMDEWRKATGGAIDVSINDIAPVGCDVEVDDAIARCASTSPWHERCVEAAGGPVVASTSLPGNNIEIVTELAPVAGMTIRTVALHELGHLIGLSHVAGGLMDPRPSIDYIDEDTLRRACELHGCDPSN